MTLAADLGRLVGDAAVLAPAPAHYLVDETEGRGGHDDDRGLQELMRESLRGLKALTAEERQLATASTQTASL